MQSLRGNPSSTTAAKTARPYQSTTASILTGTESKVSANTHYVVTDAQQSISVKTSEEKFAAEKKHEEEDAASQLATQTQVTTTEDDSDDIIYSKIEVLLLASKLQVMVDNATQLIAKSRSGDDIGDKLLQTLDNIRELRNEMQQHIKDSSKDSPKTVGHSTISATHHRQPQKKRTHKFNYLSAIGQTIALIGIVAFALCFALTPPGWVIGVGVGLAAAFVGTVMVCKATGKSKYADAVVPSEHVFDDDSRESLGADTADRTEYAMTATQTQRRRVDFPLKGNPAGMFSSPTSDAATHDSSVSQSPVASATVRP